MINFDTNALLSSLNKIGFPRLSLTSSNSSKELISIISIPLNDGKLSVTAIARSYSFKILFKRFSYAVCLGIIFHKHQKANKINKASIEYNQYMDFFSISKRLFCEALVTVLATL